MPKTGVYPQLFFVHHEAERHICQCAKFQAETKWQFWEFILWTLKTEKNRKFGKKFAKNSGRALAWPVFEIKLSYGSRITYYQNCPPIPLGGGEIGGQIFNFDQTFLEKGGSPTPNFRTVGKISPSSITYVSLVFLVREIRKRRRCHWRAP